MTNFFDQFFNRNSRPVRRRIRMRLTVDDNGNPCLETIDGETIDLSPDGSIDTTQVVPDRFYHCGCTATQSMGGQCAVPGCVQVSCARCFGRCGSCLLPLCPEHSRVIEMQMNQPIRLCPSCFEETRRRCRRRRIARCLLRPFIEFDDRQGR